MAKDIVPVVWVVLYLRMSSKKQDKSIPAQREALLALAKRKGYKVRREYVDEAVSGDKTEKRFGFLQLREDAETLRDFSIILVWDQDRLSRNDPLELGYWLKPIRDAGIIVETPQGRVDWDTLGGRLIYLISQEMKHNYLRELSRNVARGQIAATKNGRKGTGGRDPSGYSRDGDLVVVDPEAAAVIRRIFEEYDKPGTGLRSVADLLNREGIRTPKGNKWSQVSVRHVLTNAKYCGAFVRFRFQVGDYHAIQGGEIAPRRKTDGFREADDPLIFENNHEPIVSRELFDRVQRKLKRNRTRTARRDVHSYALSGLLYCGDCDRTMTGHTRKRSYGDVWSYVCRTYKERGNSACYANTVKEDPLLDCILRKIQREYLSDKAVDRIRKKIRKQQQAERRTVPPVDQKRLRKRITDLDRQIDNGTERVFSAPETIVPKLYAKLERLREERDRLQDQLTAAETPQNGRTQQDEKEVEEALRTLKELSAAIGNADPVKLRELLAGIVARIELKFSHETRGKKNRSTFETGTIFVRPPVASSLLLQTAGPW